MVICNAFLMQYHNGHLITDTNIGNEIAFGTMGKCGLCMQTETGNLLIDFFSRQLGICQEPIVQLYLWISLDEKCLHQTDYIRHQTRTHEILSSNPTSGMKARWVTLGQPVSLSLTNLTELLLGENRRKREYYVSLLP
uniref:Uncharacterized protein n=1 Tax=Micrurus lemniscatus lemniscatus TaxID=129467 RepID=A0A2D4JLS7_MICLE